MQQNVFKRLNQLSLLLNITIKKEWESQKLWQS